MFNYAGNNPVNNSDPSGNGWLKSLVKAVKKALKNFVSDYAPPKTNNVKKTTVSSISTNTPSPSLNNFKNSDGSYSLYDNTRHNSNTVFHKQILSAKVSKPSLDLKKVKLL